MRLSVSVLAGAIVVGNLLERDLGSRQPLPAQPRRFAVNYLRPVMRQQIIDRVQYRLRQHIAGSRSSVAQNAVVQQVIRRAFMNAQERRLEGLRGRLPSLEMPDIAGQRCEFHLRFEGAVGLKHRCAQSVETEAAAALPVARFRDAALLGGYDFLQAWNAMGLRMLAHFDADVAAVHFVGYSDGRS